MIFPPLAIPIAIWLNGSPLRSYNPPYLVRGQVVAPVAPFLTRVADRIDYAGGVMIVARGGTNVRIRAGTHDPKALMGVYVPIATVLRQLGATVTYDAKRRVLAIQIGTAAEIHTMPPYRAGALPAPATVFTPEPVPTPRPVYTGSPHPRRTPIVRMTSRP